MQSHIAGEGQNILSRSFDAVVMLTMSNWHTEMRGNRYHYATRFARLLPVIFVQADLDQPRFEYEETEVEGLVLLHVWRSYGWEQGVLLKAALAEKKISRPMLWVYDHDFIVFLALYQAGFTVYHATEDYFSPDLRISKASRSVLRKVLKMSDVLVAVSQGVKNSYQERGRYRGDVLIVENGCDFKFWAPPTGEMSTFLPDSSGKRVALYQGGIHRKIDFALMHELVRRLPDWEFWFCGKVSPGLHEWHSLSRHANVRYFGKLRPERVRELTYQSSVGLIPFIQNDWIIERSFPLKAFEYVACGLPVVSVPIKALQPFSDVVACAQTPEQFMDAMNRAAPTRHDSMAIAQRLKIAQRHDYELKFQGLLSTETFQAASQRSQQKRLRRRPFCYKCEYMSIFLIEGVRKELARIKRAIGMYVIHLCALAVARITRKDTEQLEQDLLRFSRKLRGIRVPVSDTPARHENWLKGGQEDRKMRLMTVVGRVPSRRKRS